jgi:hypothetical protein
MPRTLRRAAIIIASVLAGFLLALAALLFDDNALFQSDRITTTAPVIAAHLELEFGAPLPSGLTPIGLREGGFQDRFLQVALSVDAPGLAALQGLLGLAPDEFAEAPAPALGPAGEDWWDASALPGPFLIAQTATDHLDHLTIALHPDPDHLGHWRVFLWGFNT